METLQDEVLKLIFRNCFEFHELLVIRKVCRRWEFLIDESIERRPLWLKKIDESGHYYRFFNVEKVSEDKHFNVTHSLLAFRQCVEVHSRLRKLITYNPFLLVGLELDNLVHLEIKNRLPISRTIGTSQLLDFLLNPQGEQDQAVNLKFKNLRTLAFPARSYVDFVIDASKLTNLQVTCALQHIQLLDPRSVTQLSCCHYSSELLSFKNLKKLTINSLEYTSKKINCNLIKHFGSLSELTVWNMKQASFEKLIKHRQGVQNGNLKIYYKSVDIDAEQFDFPVIDRVKNDILNESSYQTYVTFADDLKEEFSQNFLVIQKNLNVPMSHFIKFRNVNCLLVRTHRLSLNNWKLLLKSLKLDDIMIGVTLGQSFLACLPKYCKYLTRLSVETYDDLDFALELKSLTNLTVRGFPTFSMLKSLVSSSKSLRNLKIFANDIPYDFRISDNLVSLARNGELVFTDSKDSFLYTSLFYTQSWTQLLDVNGNAKCQHYTD